MGSSQVARLTTRPPVKLSMDLGLLTCPLEKSSGPRRGMTRPLLVSDLTATCLRLVRQENIFRALYFGLGQEGKMSENYQ